jgi:hypothetical protein
LANYHHSLVGAKGEAVEKAQKVLRDRHRDFAQAHGVDIDELFLKRRLNYLFNIYLNNRNYLKALTITMASVVEGDDEKAHLISRNILTVIRALIQAQEGAAEKAAKKTAEMAVETATE